jgi:hypothetical protein
MMMTCSHLLITFLVLVEESICKPRMLDLVLCRLLVRNVKGPTSIQACQQLQSWLVRSDRAGGVETSGPGARTPIRTC